MKKLHNFNQDIKAMFSSPQTPASQKPSMDPRRVSIAALFVSVTLIVGVIFGYLSNSSGSKGGKDQVEATDGTQTSELSNQEGSLVIYFKDSEKKGGNQGSTVRASNGTLVRVRLLNSLETFDTVPAFVQIVDYSLGQSFYGWTLVGDATGDGNINRVKMSFSMARSPHGGQSRDLSGQALSLDGTLGVKAQKIEGMVSRSLIGAGKTAGSSLSNSVKGSGDLSSLLLRALLSGLETEISSDLGAAYNQSAALRLKPGAEFFVQLTENF